MFCNPMVKLKFNLILALLVAGTMSVGGFVQAQMDPPVPEIDLLKKDIGEWNVEIKAWDSADGDPVVTKGTESTRMFGGYWTVTNFNGNMMGLDFKGHGTYGYDTKKKKYVGTWIDSLGPYMMQMVGDYDKETQTLTMVGDSPGPDGTTMFTYTSSTCYKEGGRVMTMHMQPKGSSDDQKMKLFVMTYSKKENQKASK